MKTSVGLPKRYWRFRGNHEAKLENIADYFGGIGKSCMPRIALTGADVCGRLPFHFSVPAYRTGNSGSVSWTDVMRQRINREAPLKVEFPSEAEA